MNQMQKSDLEEGAIYWYVYVPPKCINLQVARLEKLYLDKMTDDIPSFRVLRENNGEEFLTLNMIVEDENFVFLFPFDKKDDAEKIWAREFFLSFRDAYGLEFSHFVTLYKRIQDEHPEWII